MGVEHRMLWGKAEEYRSRQKANGMSGNIKTSFVERAFDNRLQDLRKKLDANLPSR